MEWQYPSESQISAEKDIEYYKNIEFSREEFFERTSPNFEVMIAGKTLKMDIKKDSNCYGMFSTCKIIFEDKLVYLGSLVRSTDKYNELLKESYESEKIFLDKDWVKTFKIFHQCLLNAVRKDKYERDQEKLTNEQNDLANNYDLGSFEQTPKNKINNYIEEKKEKYQTKKRRLFNEFRRRFKRLFVGIMVLVTLFIMLIIIF